MDVVHKCNIAAQVKVRGLNVQSRAYKNAGHEASTLLLDVQVASGGRA